MRTRYSRTLRIISATTLAFFSWTFLSLWQIPAAIAAEKQKSSAKGQSARRPVSREQRSEEKFEQALEAIRENADKAGKKSDKGEDDSAEREAIRGEKTEIEKIDLELRKEFDATEQRLKTAKLPKEILARHAAFVEHYTSNINSLKKEIDDIDKAKTPADRKAKIEKARLHLEQAKPQKKHIPLDPNRLPHRQVRGKEKTPRLKKEEYDRDFPKQKSRTGRNIADIRLLPDLLASKPQPKPVVLAFNEAASDMPFSLGVYPIKPQIAFSDTSPIILAQQTTDLPTPEDLAENGIDIQFTPAIQAKAQELGCSAIKLYEFTRNEIFFTPTYGSILGADMCLQTKECNSFDTSSLLIAMFRSCGIPARYTYGTIEVPIEKIMNWTGGFTDPRAAISFIASGGVPVKPYASGGVITKVQMEHVWVEANVAYGPYSGRASNLNPDKIWLPLDPSYKQFIYTDGVDLQSAVPFDSQAFANQIQSTATINETEGYVTNMDANYIQATMTDYQTRIQNYISQNMPNATIGDVIGKKEIKKQEFGILPVTLPYKVITGGTTYSEIPDNLRHKVTFEIQDSSVTGNSLSYTISIPEIAGKRVTLSYAPATAADEQAISNYGSIFNVPAYLVNMKPQIKIEGAAMAFGNGSGLGNQQTFNMKFVSPSGSADSIVSNNVTAGAYYGIGVNPSKITKELIDKRRAKLEAVQGTVTDATIYTDECIGELLYTTAIAYFFELDAPTNVIAKKIRIDDLKHVSEAIVSKDINVVTAWGVPLSIGDGSMMIDVDRLVHSAIAQNGDQTKERQFTIIAGQMSSALEHGIFELMFQAKGVSTIQVLQLANAQGIPIHTITSNNISSVLPLLLLSSEVKIDVLNAVNAGKNVIIPQQDVTYYTWTGTGYIVMDPDTGSGAYMISTSLAGGAQCVAAGGLPILSLSLIAASDLWYSFNCKITSLMHYLNSPFEFLGAAALTGGIGLFLVSQGFEIAGIVGFLLGGIGLLVLIAAVFIILALIRGLIDSYSHHAYNIFNERRIYGARYNIRLV